MSRLASLARLLLLLGLLAALLTALTGPSSLRAVAAPHSQAATNIVISEFRTRGPAGTADEFVEIYNPTISGVNIGTWLIRASNNTGQPTTLATVPSGTILESGQHYLIANADGYSASVSADKTYSGPAIPDYGGIAIVNPADASTPVDQVGTDPGSAYQEGTTLAPLTTDTDQSYERKEGGALDSCVDTGDNAADFLVLAPSGPQNSSSPLRRCGVVPPTITATDTLSPSKTPTITATSSCPPPIYGLLSILINEIAWSGTDAHPEDEWMELYNPGCSPADLAGWKLRTSSGSINITLSGKIPAKGFFLLERGDDTTVSNIKANQIYTGALSDTGERLYLYNSAGGLVDYANTFSSTWGAGSVTNHRSMERRGVVLDSRTAWVTNMGVVRNGKDANGNPINGTPKKPNWATMVTLTPSPRPTVYPTRTLPPQPRPIINEFLPRAGYDWNQDGRVDVFDEFIEVANLGPVDVNLRGWKLDDQANAGSSPYTIPDMVLKPGDRAVFYGRQTNISLSDGGDTVRLLNPSGVIFDSQTYPVVKEADKSWCRLPDLRGSWYSDCFPTPNQPNSRTGQLPSAVPTTGLEEPLCRLPDVLSEDFVVAECHGFGGNIFNSGYWDQIGWRGDLPVLQNGSKWETFVE